MSHLFQAGISTNELGFISVMGVELFFETPSLSASPPSCDDKVPRGYRYHVTEVRFKYYATPVGFHHVHRIRCDTDFRSKLKVFLDQGWKLVDICFATATLPQGGCCILLVYI